MKPICKDKNYYDAQLKDGCKTRFCKVHKKHHPFYPNQAEIFDWDIEPDCPSYMWHKDFQYITFRARTKKWILYNEHVPKKWQSDQDVEVNDITGKDNKAFAWWPNLFKDMRAETCFRGKEKKLYETMVHYQKLHVKYVRRADKSKYELTYAQNARHFDWWLAHVLEDLTKEDLKIKLKRQTLRDEALAFARTLKECNIHSLPIATFETVFVDPASYPLVKEEEVDNVMHDLGPSTSKEGGEGKTWNTCDENKPCFCWLAGPAEDSKEAYDKLDKATDLKLPIHYRKSTPEHNPDLYEVPFYNSSFDACIDEMYGPMHCTDL